MYEVGLVNNTEAAEAVGDMTDGVGVGGGRSAHVVKAEDVGKEV
jgi:hypothetical protein